jgi:dihydrofolate reductase
MGEDNEFKLSLIVAVARNGVIGREGGLPWRLGSDLRRFRKLTMGHPLIMGRNTYESIGKLLDGRDSIVVTSARGAEGRESLYFVSSLAEAMLTARKAAKLRGVKEIFVIGGAKLFAEALPQAQRIYLTLVHGSPEGDVRWKPDFGAGWLERSKVERPASERDEFAVTDFVLERAGA